MHLLALLGLFTDLNDRFPYPFIYGTSTSEITSLSYTWSLKKIPLSGGASLYGPLKEVPIPSGIQALSLHRFLRQDTLLHLVYLSCLSTQALAVQKVNNTKHWENLQLGLAQLVFLILVCWIKSSLRSRTTGHFGVPNTLTFKMRLNVKMNFICMRIKNHFHINGFGLSLALKQRLERTRKWPVAILLKWRKECEV